MKTNVIVIQLLLLWVFQWSASAQEQQQRSSVKFSVKNPYEIYLGGIMKARDVNGVQRQVSASILPTAFSYQGINPGSQEYNEASYNTMIELVRKGVQAHGEKNISASFSAGSLKQYDSYKQLSLLFGEEVDLLDLFGVTSSKPTHRTLAVMDMNLTHFSIHIDMPDNGKITEDPVVQTNPGDYIYVSSIDFGRHGLLVVESDFDFRDVKSAVSELIDHYYAKGKKLSEKSQAIIAGSILKCVIKDPRHQTKISGDNPISILLDYLHTEFGPDDFGVPIYFTGAIVDGNGMFENKYGN